MTREAAERIAAGLETLAAAVREAVTEKPEVKRMKLSEVAKLKGVPASTLRELIGQRLVAAARIGKGKGVWLVSPDDVEAYLRSRTQRPVVRLVDVRA